MSGATPSPTAGESRRTSSRKRVPAARSLYADGPVSQRDEKLLHLALQKSVEEVRRVDEVQATTKTAPEFHPSEAEFADPMRYIRSVVRDVAPYGIAKIVPPPGWRCPFALRADDVHIETKLQYINRLGEGVPYGDGRTFAGEAAYRAMADEFRGAWEARMRDAELDPSLDADWERMYWRLVEGVVQEAVQVEYGNDISTEKFGSAFPTRNGVGGSTVPTAAAPAPGGAAGAPPSTDPLKIKVRRPLAVYPGQPRPPAAPPAPTPAPTDPAHLRYADSPWSLVNLPFAHGSLLRFSRDRINGINVPWLYFGMTFSTFSWHVEDNWLYSINYHHKGHTKTWYGVPPHHRAAFDAALKSMIPERFGEEPELLSQITTMMSPAYLAARGVQVCRLDHHAGEFVVTLPGAYHAGFSNGYNVGEAVNFAVLDWLPAGRACRDHYRDAARQPVIAFDKVLWAFADLGEEARRGLSVPDAELVAREMQLSVDEEAALRDALKRDGVRFSVRMPSEPPDSDEPDMRRKCAACDQPCSMSAVICRCSQERVACPRHHASLCECPPTNKCVVFWASVEELRAKRERFVAAVRLQEAAVGGVVDEDE